MATVVVPFRATSPKTRLASLPEALRDELAAAMLADVLAACEAVAPTVVADAPGGQGAAVAAAVSGLTGRLAIVNADVPCATTADLETLLAAAPALVAAPDGTTNAIALADAASFAPLYGRGSARRFVERLGATALALPSLADDVDTLGDLERVAGRAGPRTRAALATLGVAA